MRAAFVNTLANKHRRFTKLLAVTPTCRRKPDTLLFKQSHHQERHAGRADVRPGAGAVARAGGDSVSSGIIAGQSEDYCILVGVFIHWKRERQEDLRLHYRAVEGIDRAAPQRARRSTRLISRRRRRHIRSRWRGQGDLPAVRLIPRRGRAAALDCFSSLAPTDRGA